MNTVVPNVDDGPLESYRETIDSDPYDFYDSLRARGDVAWDEGVQAWLVCSNTAVREVMRTDNWRVRHSWVSIQDEALHRLAGGRRSRVLSHGDLQRRHHRWFVRRFSYTETEKWRDAFVRTIVDRTIDGFSSQGCAELVRDFCDRLSVRVITAVLGLPWESDEFTDRCKTLMGLEQQYVNVALVGAGDEATRVAALRSGG